MFYLSFRTKLGFFHSVLDWYVG